MLAYLGSTAPASIVVPANGRVVAEVLGPVVRAGAPISALAAPPTPTDMTAVVLDVISARTGYPRDMLDPDLDLEADLSIGSIKRTEMIGELADRLGLAAAGTALDESVVEDLARIKTIAGIVAWLDEHLQPGPDAPSAELVTPGGVLAPRSVTSWPGDLDPHPPNW